MQFKSQTTGGDSREPVARQKFPDQKAIDVKLFLWTGQAGCAHTWESERDARRATSKPCWVRWWLWGMQAQRLQGREHTAGCCVCLTSNPAFRQLPS